MQDRYFYLFVQNNDQPNASPLYVHVKYTSQRVTTLLSLQEELLVTSTRALVYVH